VHRRTALTQHAPHSLLDDVIHQRTRLAIMATLTAVEELDFGELRAGLDLTDGNLSTHATALQQAGYVRITKGFRGRRPRTTLAMTPKGRKALERYVNLLRGLLKHVG
jgi:DNA-binding MarR family transcriptional regulator